MQDNPSLARLVFDFISEGSKEMQAVRFLVSPSPLAEKELAFRRSLPEEHGWFAEYIIGEHHLKGGKRKEALAAYERSDEAIRQAQQDNLHINGLLIEQVKQRLQELDAVDRSTEPGQSQGTGN